MGLKDGIYRLHEALDRPLLVTEELHQVYTVEGFKRKNLELLLDAFAIYGYTVKLFYRPSDFELQKAGRLSTHLAAAASIPLRLEPILTIKNKNVKLETDTAIDKGRSFFHTKFPALQKQVPDDWQNLCEYMGRLATFYDNFEQWQWYLCAKSGTTLNIHLMPVTTIDPVHLLTAGTECQLARLQNVNVYPHTVEIVFLAYSKIEQLPYNRRNRRRYTPYSLKTKSIYN